MPSEVLVVSEKESLVVHESGASELLEVGGSIEIVEVGAQGLPGPPGTNALPYGRALHIDASRPIAYVAFASRIQRLDYTGYPPSITSFMTLEPEADWPNRAQLEYT